MWIEAWARRRAGEALDAWNVFWFEPASDATLTIFRTGLGLGAFAWAISLAPDLGAFYAESGLLPDPAYERGALGLFRCFESDGALYAGYVALLVAAAAVTTGFAVRAFAPLLFVGVASFQQDNPLVLNSGDLLLRVLCAHFGLFALLTPNQALGRSLRELARTSAPLAQRLGPNWGMRLIQLQLTIVYPFSVIDKLRGGTWHDGTAALWALQVVDLQRFPAPEFVLSSPLLGNLMTYATLGLEFSLPFLLWNERTRRRAIALGLGLHLCLALPISLGFFSAFTALAYVAFVKPAEMEQVIAELRRRISGRAAESSRPTSPSEID